MPNRFKSRWLRPLDYAIKFIRTCMLIVRRRPQIIYLQFPAVYIALPAWLLRTPYVVDAHNSTWQSFWHNVPFARFLMRHARAVMVHNDEILDVAKREDPACNYVVVRDPIADLSQDLERTSGRILLICSFVKDEPEGVILDVIQSTVNDFTFVIPGSMRGVSASIMEQLRSIPNVVLTGFLSKEEYERELCSCGGVVVLTTREGCQPCGACEALASNTPLIVSRTKLIERLFGDWAILVDNSPIEIVDALRALPETRLDLFEYRLAWQEDLQYQLKELMEIVNE